MITGIFLKILGIMLLGVVAMVLFQFIAIVVLVSFAYFFKN